MPQESDTPPAEPAKPAGPARLRSPAALAALVALCTLALALVPRLVRGDRHYWPRAEHMPEGTEDAAFFALDPDGLYHVRRVERAFAEGLPVAETDPCMSYPDGARIPWPPYYDTLLFATAAPFAPEDGIARRRFVEQWVATVPLVCGVLTSLCVALAAWLLAGPLAALTAGAYHALTFGSINYTTLGTGDHHGWVALLLSALLLGLGEAFRTGLPSARRGLAWGIGLGAVVALLLGSWVASLVYVVVVDLALGWLLLARSRRELPGLAPLGLALHGTAALGILPAVLTSPWTEDSPWMVVNLSWMHPAYLVLGALVFVPLLAIGRTRLRAGTRAARLYPLGVAVALLALGLALVAFDAGPARGVREALDWATRSEAFMGMVEESWPMVGPRARGIGVLLLALGIGALLAPFAWGQAAVRALRDAQWALLPWVVAFPVLAAQALQQKRFADALAVPLAVLLGCATGRGARWRRAVWIPAVAAGVALAWWSLAAGRRPDALAVAAAALLGWVGVRTSRWPARAWIPAVVALAVLCHHRSLAPRVRTGFDPPRKFWGEELVDHALGERLMLEWLRERTAPGDWSVLAPWDLGHAIEWVADRPSVATNFGSYVGEESFRDPPAFYLSRSESEGIEVLGRRRARYVLVPGDLVRSVPMMIRVHCPERRDELLAQRRLAPAWYETTGARLLPQTLFGQPGEPMLVRTHPFERLRLVHASRSFDLRTFDPRAPDHALRAGWIWERVAGGVVEARGEPGERLAVSLRVEYAGARVTLDFQRAATAGADGIARVRIPYATEVPNGDGVAVGPARWQMGGRSGELSISGEDVIAGRTVALE